MVLQLQVFYVLKLVKIFAYIFTEHFHKDVIPVAEEWHRTPKCLHHLHSKLVSSKTFLYFLPLHIEKTFPVLLIEHGMFVPFRLLLAVNELRAVK